MGSYSSSGRSIRDRYGELPRTAMCHYKSWFKTLKAEEVYLTEYETIADVLKNVPRFIETVYNDNRLHSSLGYFNPVEFEELAAKGQLKNQGLDPVMQLPGKHSS